LAAAVVEDHQQQTIRAAPVAIQFLHQLHRLAAVVVVLTEQEIMQVWPVVQVAAVQPKMVILTAVPLLLPVKVLLAVTVLMALSHLLLVAVAVALDKLELMLELVAKQVATAVMVLAQVLADHLLLMVAVAVALQTRPQHQVQVVQAAAEMLHRLE
jgi:hypothetical protein